LEVPKLRHFLVFFILYVRPLSFPMEEALTAILERGIIVKYDLKQAGD
jgi:hypothetical protein